MPRKKKVTPPALGGFSGFSSVPDYPLNWPVDPALSYLRRLLDPEVRPPAPPPEPASGEHGLQPNPARQISGFLELPEGMTPYDVEEVRRQWEASFSNLRTEHFSHGTFLVPTPAMTETTRLGPAGDTKDSWWDRILQRFTELELARQLSAPVDPPSRQITHIGDGQVLAVESIPSTSEHKPNVPPVGCPFCWHSSDFKVWDPAECPACGGSHQIPVPDSAEGSVSTTVPWSALSPYGKPPKADAPANDILASSIVNLSRLTSLFAPRGYCLFPRLRDLVFVAPVTLDRQTKILAGLGYLCQKHQRIWFEPGEAEPSIGPWQAAWILFQTYPFYAIPARVADRLFVHSIGRHLAEEASGSDKETVIKLTAAWGKLLKPADLLAYAKAQLELKKEQLKNSPANPDVFSRFEDLDL